MEPEEGKKINDDVLVFMTKRSQTDSPRYITSLKTYADVQKKRRRAAAARRNAESERRGSPNRNDDPKDKHVEKTEQQGREDGKGKKRVTGRSGQRSRSVSWSQASPSDACCRRRKRRRRRPKRRRRSCRRRRRRSCRRKRRRSCSRRRRRRSCRRRRKRRRRRRC